MDLQKDSKFVSLDMELVSVAADHPDSWKGVAAQYGIEDPGRLLSDTYNRVADRYGVMRWRVPTTADVDSAEPGHTFVLVGEDQRILWVRDYGAPENGGVMYVKPAELLRDMQGEIQEGGISE